MNIAIIDDDRNAARYTKVAVEDAGYDPWVFEGDTSSIESAADLIMNRSEGAICDHRLRPYGLAQFDGAELVAYLIERTFPAILISQFVNQDYDVSIRHWRAKLPSVISRDDLEGETIQKGIMLCREEFAGIVSSKRRRHRSLLRVLDLRDEDNQQVVDVVVPSWASGSAVRFPLEIVPEAFRHHVVRGSYLIAYINLGATVPEELFFDNFELPATPDDAIFNNV